MKKIKEQKGFTLVEMLIVVAIIAILVAVSIPVVSDNLEKSRVAVDQANERAAVGAAVAGFATNGNTWLANGAIHKGDKLELYYYIDPKTKQGAIGAVAYYEIGFNYGQSTKEGRGDTNVIPKGKGIHITMSLTGNIEKVEWTEEPPEIPPVPDP